MAFRCLFRLGMARPSPMPATMAATIHTGRKRSRNDSRAMTGVTGEGLARGTVGHDVAQWRRQRSRCDEAAQQHELAPVVVPARSGPRPQQALSPGAAERSCAAGHLDVGQDGVDLPRLAAWPCTHTLSWTA